MKEQSKTPAKMTKKMKTGLGKPSGKTNSSGQPKSPIKKDLLLPNPSSPTNVSSSNKRVQVASPTVETPRPNSPSGLNSNTMSESPNSPLQKHALSYSKVFKKFSPNSYSSEDTMDRIIAKKTEESEDDDTDSTESAVIKERIIKQRQLIQQSKEVVIDDSSAESFTPSVEQAGTNVYNTAAADVKDDASDWESVEEDNRKSAETANSSGAPSPAQETKKSTSKSQLSIKSLFQKQHQLNKASKPVSMPKQVKVENYHFDPDDHITALLEDIHQEIALLLCKAYEVANSFSLHPREGPFQVNYHVNDNEMWVVNKDNVGVLKVPDELWVEINKYVLIHTLKLLL